jgi:5-methylcytosine-specific restriction enzyme subunit McrC
VFDSPLEFTEECQDQAGYVGRIPVRNLWLLLLYASNLYRDLLDANVAIEENPDKIPDLVAKILCDQVELRLKRNLSFGYIRQNQVLRRVRGRIDLLYTQSHGLLQRGQIACHFDELTIDTVRNRFVRSALEKVSKIVDNKELAHRCRALANTLRSMGVVGESPQRFEASIDRFGRHDMVDKRMVAAAHLAFLLALPTESSGKFRLPTPEREFQWLTKLFEKGIAGFYDVTLCDKGWKVEAGKKMYWQTNQKSPGIGDILPTMTTDIILENEEQGRRIVIDTKFNSILTKGWYRSESLRNIYIYQMYSYLRSQEVEGDSCIHHSSGILLHPSIERDVDEAVEIQGHVFRFATVNLGAESSKIRTQLLKYVEPFF